VNKEIRIRGLIPRYESGSVFHLKGECADLEEELMSFPQAVHDDVSDACLVNSTLVATSKGNKKIEDIRVGDKVITPTGLKRVVWAGVTGVKEVIDNIGITGTPDHKIFNNNSFDKLDTIVYNDHISKLTKKGLFIWLYKKLLRSMAQPIALWEGKESIISLNQIQIRGGKVLKDFTWRFGNFITKRQFQKGIVFIIKMAILLITTLKIWNVYQLGNTCQTILREIVKIKSLWKKLKLISVKLKNLLRNGTNQKLAGNGIENTLKRLFTEQLLPEFALNVGQNIRQPVLEVDFVKGNVMESIRQGNGERNTQTTIRKVYNLTVEDDHVYYANGILVANCAYQVQIARKPYEPIIRRFFGTKETKNPAR